MIYALYILIGLAAGVLSGLMGIGGGLIVVPALILFAKLTQHQAQGVSLAMLLPPIGILAVWRYAQAGYVDYKIAGILCIGFILGSVLGANLAMGLPEVALRRVFGVVLLLIALKFILNK